MNNIEVGDNVRLAWEDATEYAGRVWDVTNDKLTVVFTDTPKVQFTFYHSGGTMFRDVSGKSLFIERSASTGAP